ncbi:heparinase II/III domain-containing protein [Pseudoduganella armeniaca]|nr:heparinase II/III family protein [Pseudoduganella armeniaca]
MFTVLPLVHAVAQAQTEIRPETLVELEDAVLPVGWSKGTNATAGLGYATVTTGISPVASSSDQTVAPLTLTLKSDHMATYHVWVRYFAPNGASDSFWAAVGSAAYSDRYTTNYTTPQWVKIGTAVVDAGGTASIKLKYRETNLQFDKVLVTALPSFTPTGAGTVPTASSAMPANPYTNTPDVLPTGPHPRLFLGNSTDRASILESRRLAYLPANVGKTEFDRLRDSWDTLNTAAHSAIPATPTDLKTQCPAYATAIQAKALYYQLDGDSTLAKEAVTMMRTYMDACGFELDGNGKRVPMSARPAGDMITLSALVYDWCTPYVSEADTQLYLRRFLELAPMEIGFPPERQGHLVGHGSEHQLMRDQLSAGIAFYEKEPRIYEIAGAKFFRDFVPARRDYLYKSGAFHQGPSYGQARFTSDMFAAWIFRRMAGVDVFGDKGKDVLYHAIHMRRPDGQLMRDGDTFDGVYTPHGWYWFQPTPYMLAASYFRDPYLQAEYARQVAVQGKGADNLWRVLFSDLSVPAGTKSLPWTTFYGEPAGYMVARTGAPVTKVDLASNTVVATMKVGHTNFANHQHLDAGHFQLYYKGGLAIDSGIYEGKIGTQDSGYGSPHDKNYHKRTIAHNAMLVFQPGEKFADTPANDGGQRFILHEPKSLQELDTWSEPYHYGGNIRHRIGPDTKQPAFSYLTGNLHDAYTDKVANYQRSFVFLNLNRTDVPAALVVFDRIRSSQPTYRKSWLLHSVGEPIVNEAAKTITIERRDQGYNGKLVNRTLLPAQVQYKKYGQAGEEYLVPNTDGTAMVNYPVAVKYERNSEEAGPWRMEVSPSAPQESDLMLNVMQVMDANGTAVPVPVDLLQSAQFVGARVANRVVLFGKGETSVGTGASFLLLAEPADVLIADLQPGTWQVKKNGVLQAGSYVVGADDGTIYLQAQGAGAYELVLVKPAL